MTALTWSPTINFVRQTIANEGRLRLIVAPFIKIDALRELVDECKDVSDLQVVVRWQPADLVTGVSDVEIYPFLREKGVALFRHPSIHLKLLVYNQSLAFHTSGNVTQKGLGLTDKGNVEVGCPVTLDHGDWDELLNVLALSEEVDEQMYDQALQYSRENKREVGKLPELNLHPAQSKRFSLDSLPASESPETLFRFYSGEPDARQSLDDSPAFVHDLMLFAIPKGLEGPDFFALLEANFKASEFIQAMVSFIRSEESARFGAVNSWIAENCSDTPRPYRRDVKTTTRRLYTWLEYFYEEVSWDTPNYSMVVYWNRSD